MLHSLSGIMDIKQILKNNKYILLKTLNIFNEEIIFIDTDYNILWLNREKKLRHPDLDVGSKCYQAFHNKQPCEFCLAEEAKQIKGPIKNPICIYYRKKKKIPQHFNVMISPIISDKEELIGYIEIVDNIEGLYQTNYRLEHLNKEYENVIYALSHDLRSPLVSIEGFIRKLIKKHISKDNADAQHCLNRIHANVETMNNLVKVLLDTSRIATGKLEIHTVDLDIIIDGIIERYREQTQKKGCSIIKKNKLGTANCDKLRTEQIFSNLIGNSIQHSGEVKGLKIEIGAENGVYWVKDNGPGIPEDFKEHAFEPFTQGEKISSESFGMGMNIVYKIIQKHGGRIWLESLENQGTFVYFTLE